MNVPGSTPKVHVFPVRALHLRPPAAALTALRGEGDQLVALRIPLDGDVLVLALGAGVVDLHADRSVLTPGEGGGRVPIVVDQLAVHGDLHAARVAVGQDLGPVPFGHAHLIVGLGIVLVGEVVPDGAVGGDHQQA